MDQERLKLARKRQLNLSLELSGHVLEKLISEGYSGDDLIIEFKKQSKSINHAILQLLDEADSIASDDKFASNLEDIFKPH